MISISHEAPWNDQGQKCVHLLLRNVYSSRDSDNVMHRALEDIKQGDQKVTGPLV